MSCLNDIVSIGSLCEGVYKPSTAIFDLFSAPEISKTSITKIANSDYITAKNLLLSTVSNAVKDVEFDLMQTLLANGFITQFNPEIYNTSIFKQNDIIYRKDEYRGIVLHKTTKLRKGIKSLRISQIGLYPFNNVDDAILRFEDGGLVSEIHINLKGGEINLLDVNIPVQSDSLSVLLNCKDVDMYPSDISCFVGCNGSIPNECAYAQGWNGKSFTKKEGFGINVKFTCDCDYSQLLCKFSGSFSGMLIFLKSRIRLLEETLHGDRYNNYTLFNRDDKKELLGQLQNEYHTSFSNFVQAMPVILKNIDSDCITCLGPRIITNL